MNSKNVGAKILAIIGTILVWVPLLAMLIIALINYLSGAPFSIDYLIPAEVTPVWLAGGVLLLIAAILVRKRRAIMIASLVAGVILLFGTQLVAVVTGLASGLVPPAGLAFSLVNGGIIAFDVSLVVFGNAGISLIRDLFKKAPPSTPPSEPTPTPPSDVPPPQEGDIPPSSEEPVPDQPEETIPPHPAV